MAVSDASPRTGLPRTELIGATDEQIEDAVTYADPVALRGLLYQLTGDESLLAMALTSVRFGAADVAALADDSDVEHVQAMAAEFLKAYRDGGAGRDQIGPSKRLPRSLALVAGIERLPDDDLGLWLEELALDPWARGIEWEQTPTPEQLQGFSVSVIGAGMGGLNAAVQLKQAGIAFTVLEKNSERRRHLVREPLSRRAGRLAEPQLHAYLWRGLHRALPVLSGRGERRYFNWVADSFDVRDAIVFDTEVTSVVWDESTAEWEVTADGPDGRRVWRANVVFSAVGFLSRANMPEIEGIEEFGGPSFHTARWPQDLDLRGKRVAVIGTGCTGYQLIPEVALEAAHVYVFQRTPQWVFDVPGYRSPFPPQVTWLDRNFPFFTNFMRFQSNWMARPEVAALMFDIDPEFEDPHARSEFNKQTREERIEYLRRKLADRPELIDKMIPEHPPFSARPVAADAEYSILDALVRDNVTLITERICRITHSGIEAGDGDMCDVDVIVYATGFKANQFLWPMEVRGREGRQVDGAVVEGRAARLPGRDAAGLSEPLPALWPEHESVRGRARGGQPRGDGHAVRARVHATTHPQRQPLGRRHRGCVLALQPGA